MGPRSKANGTSRRFLQDGELAHRFALSYRTEPLFPSAGICQKGVEFAFDQDPKLGDLVTGRRQRLTRHERSHAISLAMAASCSESKPSQNRTVLNQATTCSASAVKSGIWNLNKDVGARASVYR